MSLVKPRSYTSVLSAILLSGWLSGFVHADSESDSTSSHVHHMSDGQKQAYLFEQQWDWPSYFELLKLFFEKKKEQKNLAAFDTLDFDVFNHQDWENLGDSHHEDIVVYWPDGRVTHGIDVHKADLAAMFVWSPDLQISEHPIRIGDGNWTAVVGHMEGHFTEAMPLPDGTSIPPTGNYFNIKMATIAYWRNGVMTEEHLFWDNADFFRQLGI